MNTMQVDFWGRVHGFLDAFGVLGLFLIFILFSIIVAIVFWRGTGVLIFVLLISYSIGTIEAGGIAPLATLVRWVCFFLLMIGLFKNYSFPKISMVFIVLYALLGLLFVVRSPVPSWSFQRSMLLLITIIGVSLGTGSYVTSIVKIENLFKMGIIAAFFWTVACLLFVKEYTQSAYATFAAATSADTIVSGAGLAWAGAYFAPMIAWGIIQNKYKAWRIFCGLLFAPFVFVILLLDVRTALFGMLIIASSPVFLLKIRPLKLIGIMIVIGCLAMISLYTITLIIPEKSEAIFERILSLSTSGRVERWSNALKLCVDKALFVGFGIGSDAKAGIETAGLFHSSYLSIWYNTGFLGLVSMLMFLVIYTVKSIHLIRIKKTEEFSILPRVFLGYMLGTVAIGFFEGSFAESGGIAVCMLIIVAVLIDKTYSFISCQHDSLCCELANNS
jgi:O-antigen ligase